MQLDGGPSARGRGRACAGTCRGRRCRRGTWPTRGRVGESSRISCWPCCRCSSPTSSRLQRYLTARNLGAGQMVHHLELRVRDDHGRRLCCTPDWRCWPSTTITRRPCGRSGWPTSTTRRISRYVMRGAPADCLESAGDHAREYRPTGGGPPTAAAEHARTVCGRGRPDRIGRLEPNRSTSGNWPCAGRLPKV